MAASQYSPQVQQQQTPIAPHHTEQSSIPESIGKRVDPVYSRTLQERVKELLRTQHDGFPGSQPVSFESKHLKVLQREDYYVCEKTDGVRYLLFFVHSPKGPATFMFDRNKTWFYIPNLLFPVRNRDREYLKDTLMDGELVMDIDDNQKKTWRFLAFDLMALNAVSIIQRSFNTRLGLLQQEVLSPLNASLRQVTDPSKNPPFMIELKKMERGYGVQLVFDQMTKLKHKSDGVIFTPVKYPYVPGTCEKLLKWKPPELNTVDFRISARFNKEHKLIYSLEVLSHGVTYKFYDHFQPEPVLAQEWRNQPPNNRIAEFRFDDDLDVTIVEQGYAPITRKGGWRFVRFREDKDTANDENVVKKILASIRDGVTKEQLLVHMDGVRAAWKAREKEMASTSRQNSMDMSSLIDRRRSDAEFCATSTDKDDLIHSQIVDDAPNKEHSNKREVDVIDDAAERKRHKAHKEDWEESYVEKETKQGLVHDGKVKVDLGATNDLRESEIRPPSAERLVQLEREVPSLSQTIAQQESSSIQTHTTPDAEKIQPLEQQATIRPKERPRRRSSAAAHPAPFTTQGAISSPSESDTKLRKFENKTSRRQGTYLEPPPPVPSRSSPVPSTRAEEVIHTPDTHYAHAKYTEENGSRFDHRSKSIPDVTSKMRQSSTSSIHSLLTTPVEPLSSATSSPRQMNERSQQHPCNFESILHSDKRESEQYGARQFINYHVDGSHILTTSSSSSSSYHEPFYEVKTRPPPPAWQQQAITSDVGQQQQQLSPTMLHDHFTSAPSSPPRGKVGSWRASIPASPPSGYSYQYLSHPQQHPYVYDSHQQHRHPASDEDGYQRSRYAFERPSTEQHTNDETNSKRKRSGKAMLDFILN
ncbi:Dcp1p-Dcp2p decapping enzyme complex alpha subunit [Apophysomyces sp. BC1021]|nr:Dcp1p-Dcp2p decapping enzyme complex alpha subunit [Apophysomyces sp. BC1021]